MCPLLVVDRERAVRCEAKPKRAAGKLRRRRKRTGRVTECGSAASAFRACDKRSVWPGADQRSARIVLVERDEPGKYGHVVGSRCSSRAKDRLEDAVHVRQVWRARGASSVQRVRGIPHSSRRAVGFLEKRRRAPPSQPAQSTIFLEHATWPLSQKMGLTMVRNENLQSIVAQITTDPKRSRESSSVCDHWDESMTTPECPISCTALRFARCRHVLRRPRVETE